MTGAKFKAARTGGLLLLVLFLALGCTLGPTHFIRNWKVADAFENGKLLTDHQYYHFGYPSAPDALVAIQDGYVLTSPKWQPIKLDERQLKELVERMKSQPGAEYNIFSNGAEIYNDHSEVIGAWYSVWQLPVLTFIDKTVLAISDPFPAFPSGNNGSDGDDFPLRSH